MNTEKPTLADLQEILFWQQLNGQLIRLKETGKPLRDIHHEYLQDYCFQNRLFSTITSAPLVTEVPLTLLTDLSHMNCITLNSDSWIKFLLELFPEMFTLDLEQALADQFDALQKYKAQYPMTESDAEDGDDSDQELYNLIDEYLDLRQKQKRDLAELSDRLHEMKVDALTQIKKQVDLKPFTRNDEGGLSLDYEDCSGRDHINDTYNTVFCEPARSLIEQVVFILHEMDLYGFLNSRKKKGTRPSIEKFVDHELSLAERETSLFRAFVSNVNERTSRKDLYQIQLCGFHLSSFLDHPFPLI